jgi:hypothetical protein
MNEGFGEILNVMLIRLCFLRTGSFYSLGRSSNVDFYNRKYRLTQVVISYMC